MENETKKLERKHTFTLTVHLSQVILMHIVSTIFVLDKE